MPRSDTIESKLHSVLSRIQASALSHGRQASDIELLAVSKTQPADNLRKAYSAGQRHFGENYLQEAIEKKDVLADCQIIWHFIGAIQSNKTRVIAEHFSWVHSVDRLKIAQRLSEARTSEQTPLNICLQINISNEPTKAGLSLAELPEIAKQIQLLPNIKLRGLMALPAPNLDYDKQRNSFAKVKHAFNSLNQQGLALDTLSMGMSNDIEAAIAEGSTIVRIGSAIFGARK